MAGKGGRGGLLLALIAALGVGGYLGYQLGEWSADPPPPITIELESPYPKISKSGESIYRISTQTPSAKNGEGPTTIPPCECFDEREYVERRARNVYMCGEPAPECTDEVKAWCENGPPRRICEVSRVLKVRIPRDGN